MGSSEQLPLQEVLKIVMGIENIAPECNIDVKEAEGTFGGCVEQDITVMDAPAVSHLALSPQDVRKLMFPKDSGAGYATSKKKDCYNFENDALMIMSCEILQKKQVFYNSI